MARCSLALVFAPALVVAVLSSAPEDQDQDSDLECEVAGDLHLLQKEISLHLENGSAAEKQHHSAGEDEKPILITNALEEWQNALYWDLKSSGVPVRALVNRSADASALLGCGHCDESEGIFVHTLGPEGALVDDAVIRQAISGVRAVVSQPLSYSNTEVAANIIKITAQESPGATFVMVSEMNTTAVDQPSARSQKILHWEAELLSSGLQHAIVKTCQREDGPSGEKELLVFPGDQSQLLREFEGVPIERFTPSQRISQGDVARVAKLWAMLPRPAESTEGLRLGARFDLCAAETSEQPTTEAALSELATKAFSSWQLVEYETSSQAPSAAPILVTGATGRTGRIVYRLLKEKGVPLRAFVRNLTKAREVLGCNACDESEGIFLGDVSDAATFMPAIWGIRGIIITTGGKAICSGEGGFDGCFYPETREADMFATYLQAFAAGEAAEKSGWRPFVFYVSSMDVDRQHHDQLFFNKLNGEVLAMSQGLPFAIVKPCKLTSDEGGRTEVLVGPADALVDHADSIPRADLAKLLVEMATDPPRALRGPREVVRGESSDLLNLRFDVCGGLGSQATNLGDPYTVQALLRQAAYYGLTYHVE